MGIRPIAILAIAILPLLSCSKKEKDRLLVGEIPGTNGATSLGTLTVGTGGSTFVSPSPEAAPIPNASNVIPTATITIQNIELLTDGSDWISVLPSPTALALTTEFRADFQPISNPISIPTGEYHGVRVTISPNTTFENVSVSETFGDHPLFYLAYKHALEVSDHVELTSATGAFTPFTISETENTYLTFGLKFGWGGPYPYWQLIIQANATKITP